MSSSDCIEEESSGPTSATSASRRPALSLSASATLAEEEQEEMQPENNIDRVCKLIHELKEQDLSRHKKRIAERVSE